MINFPSIDQFRNAVSNVRRRTSYAGKDEAGEPILDHSRPVPTIEYRGTVKLHGTNAGIVYDCETTELTYQSRERELTLQHDNAGFMLAMMAKADYWKSVAYLLGFKAGPYPRTVAVFGEWCGQGIQKGVGISTLPKMFVVFAVKVFDVEGNAMWLDLAELDEFSPSYRIFNVTTFGTWNISVNFALPETAQNEMVKLTEAVEARCPAAKYFGVDGIGEGIVWQGMTQGWRSSDFWFKVKGEKHSASKVKTLAPVDAEAAKNIHEFVERVVTESRLEQGLHNLQVEQLKPFEMTSMGDFIRWVYNDVLKEETDTIVASQLDPKKLGGPIANKARPWFVAKLNASLQLA